MRPHSRREVRQVAFRDVPLPAILPLWLAGAYVIYYVISTYPRRHWLGADAHAYWLTAHHHDLYGVAVGSVDAYNYSPAFAQVIHPIAVLPWPVFLAIWMALEAFAFAWLLAPMGWRWAVPFWLCCSVAVGFGNVWPFLAVAFVAGPKRPSAWSFPILTKVSPGIGLLWHVARREWRKLAIAILATLAISAVSYAIDPQAWQAWIYFLRSSRGDGSGSTLRLIAAAILVVLAARKTRYRWLLLPALIVSSPILAGWQWITVLAGIPRLIDWAPAAETSAAEPPAVVAGTATTGLR